MLKHLLLSLLVIPAMAQEKREIRLQPEVVVQKQLEAYNAHNIEQFVDFYSDKAQTMDLGTGKVYRNGLTEIRKAYSDLFTQFPKLKCTVVSRIVQGDFVVDKEVLEGTASPVVFATAVYQVKDGKIVKVWFL